jgi:hypothetical protein
VKAVVVDAAEFLKSVEGMLDDLNENNLIVQGAMTQVHSM